MKARKLFFTMVMVAGLPITSLIANPLLLNLQVKYEEPGENTGRHKSPILPPYIGIEDYTLYLYSPCDGCEVRIVNADMEVEYSTIIPNGTNSLDLPTELSGEYELEIIQGGICFYTYIEL